MKLVVTLIVLALLCIYLGWNLRALIRSGLDFARRSSEGMEKIARATRVAAREPEEPLLAYNDPRRITAARSTRRKIREIREEKRHRRLDRARARWSKITSGSFPRMNRRQARARWEERKGMK